MWLCNNNQLLRRCCGLGHIPVRKSLRCVSPSVSPSVPARSASLSRMHGAGPAANVMEQFNPGLRNLVTLGKNYEKSVTANEGVSVYEEYTVKQKLRLLSFYFPGTPSSLRASPVENVKGVSLSPFCSVVLMEISDAHRKVFSDLDESFKRFHREIIIELEKKTEMDVKYMNATFKRYQSEHKVKLDSLERSQTELKKLRRKSQGKQSSKYEIKTNENTDLVYRCAKDRSTSSSRRHKYCLYVETISSRQMDMQKFMADGCREALLEEMRRFCFLADKHCMFSYQISDFHQKAKDTLSMKLPSWQEKCSDITKVPDTVTNMIDELSSTPEQSPHNERNNRNKVGSGVPPPAPPLKAQPSPLVDMFNQEPRFSLTPLSLTPLSDPTADQNSLGDVSMSRSTSQSSGLNVARKARVRTIFPHTAGHNDTLLSFDEGDIISLLIHEEKDGWLYGELEKTQHNLSTPVRSLSVASLQEQDEEEPVLLPPRLQRRRPLQPPLLHTLPQKHVMASTPLKMERSQKHTSVPHTTELVSLQWAEDMPGHTRFSLIITFLLLCLYSASFVSAASGFHQEIKHSEGFFSQWDSKRSLSRGRESVCHSEAETNSHE
ncbi:hypothetical protein NQZ68_036146 [Dissostichus eleginoides]|nr:hypothetical protein NQZ68_036146 [Dissostichus eleginoides]